MPLAEAGPPRHRRRRQPGRARRADPPGRRRRASPTGCARCRATATRSPAWSRRAASTWCSATPCSRSSTTRPGWSPRSPPRCGPGGAASVLVAGRAAAVLARAIERPPRRRASALLTDPDGRAGAAGHPAPALRRGDRRGAARRGAGSTVEEIHGVRVVADLRARPRSPRPTRRRCSTLELAAAGPAAVPGHRHPAAPASPGARDRRRRGAGADRCGRRVADPPAYGDAAASPTCCPACCAVLGVPGAADVLGLRPAARRRATGSRCCSSTGSARTSCRSPRRTRRPWPISPPAARPAHADRGLPVDHPDQPGHPRHRRAARRARDPRLHRAACPARPACSTTSTGATTRTRASGSRCRPGSSAPRAAGVRGHAW